MQKHWTSERCIIRGEAKLTHFAIVCSTYLAIGQPVKKKRHSNQSLALYGNAPIDMQ